MSIRHKLSRKTTLGIVFGLGIACVFISFFALSHNTDESQKVASNKTKDSSKLKDEDNEELAVADQSESSPGTVLNLSNWKLTLPTDSIGKGEPDEIEQPDLNTFSNEKYFYTNADKTGVVFRADAGGITTKGSSYPRSELREMTQSGSERASWSTTEGSHSMTIRQAITHLPDSKNQLVAGQIHDENDDVIMIRLEGKHLFVESDGENIGDLDMNYLLGTVFVVRIDASNGHIKVYYNNVSKVDIAKNGSGYYFKAGCYTQTNTTKGDSANSYGEVVINQVTVSHK